MVFYGYTPHFSLLLENSCRASRTLHLANANLLFAAAPLFSLSLSAPPPRRGHRLHLMRCSELTSERSSAGWRLLLRGERRASVARSKRVVNEEIVQERAPELNTVLYRTSTFTSTQVL